MASTTEFLVHKTELTNVANAIRTKFSITSSTKLVWPNDYIVHLQDIGVSPTSTAIGGFPLTPLAVNDPVGIFDTDEPTLYQILPELGNFEKGIFQIKWSPNHNYVAIVANLDNDTQPTNKPGIWIYDVTTTPWTNETSYWLGYNTNLNLYSTFMTLIPNQRPMACAWCSNNDLLLWVKKGPSGWPETGYYDSTIYTCARGYTPLAADWTALGLVDPVYSGGNNTTAKPVSKTLGRPIYFEIAEAFSQNTSSGNAPYPLLFIGAQAGIKVYSEDTWVATTSFPVFRLITPNTIEEHNHLEFLAREDWETNGTNKISIQVFDSSTYRKDIWVLAYGKYHNDDYHTVHLFQVRSDASAIHATEGISYVHYDIFANITELQEQVTSLAWSRDGNYVAIGHKRIGTSIANYGYVSIYKVNWSTGTNKTPTGVELKYKFKPEGNVWTNAPTNGYVPLVSWRPLEYGDTNILAIYGAAEGDASQLRDIQFYKITDEAKTFLYSLPLTASTDTATRSTPPRLAWNWSSYQADTSINEVGGREFIITAGKPTGGYGNSTYSIGVCSWPIVDNFNNIIPNFIKLRNNNLPMAAYTAGKIGLGYSTSTALHYQNFESETIVQKLLSSAASGNYTITFKQENTQLQQYTNKTLGEVVTYTASTPTWSESDHAVSTDKVSLYIPGCNGWNIGSTGDLDTKDYNLNESITVTNSLTLYANKTTSGGGYQSATIKYRVFGETTEPVANATVRVATTAISQDTGGTSIVSSSTTNPILENITWASSNLYYRVVPNQYYYVASGQTGSIAVHSVHDAYLTRTYPSTMTIANPVANLAVNWTHFINATIARIYGIYSLAGTPGTGVATLTGKRCPYTSNPAVASNWSTVTENTNIYAGDMFYWTGTPQSGYDQVITTYYDKDHYFTFRPTNNGEELNAWNCSGAYATHTQYAILFNGTTHGYWTWWIETTTPQVHTESYNTSVTLSTEVGSTLSFDSGQQKITAYNQANQAVWSIKLNARPTVPNRYTYSASILPSSIPSSIQQNYNTTGTGIQTTSSQSPIMHNFVFTINTGIASIHYKIGTGTEQTISTTSTVSVGYDVTIQYWAVAATNYQLASANNSTYTEAMGETDTSWSPKAWSTLSYTITLAAMRASNMQYGRWSGTTYNNDGTTSTWSWSGITSGQSGTVTSKGGDYITVTPSTASGTSYTVTCYRADGGAEHTSGIQNPEDPGMWETRRWQATATAGTYNGYDYTISKPTISPSSSGTSISNATTVTAAKAGQTVHTYSISASQSDPLGYIDKIAVMDSNTPPSTGDWKATTWSWTGITYGTTKYIFMRIIADTANMAYFGRSTWTKVGDRQYFVTSVTVNEDVVLTGTYHSALQSPITLSAPIINDPTEYIGVISNNTSFGYNFEYTLDIGNPNSKYAWLLLDLGEGFEKYRLNRPDNTRTEATPGILITGGEIFVRTTNLNGNTTTTPTYTLPNDILTAFLGAIRTKYLENVSQGSSSDSIYMYCRFVGNQEIRVPNSDWQNWPDFSCCSPVTQISISNIWNSPALNNPYLVDDEIWSTSGSVFVKFQSNQPVALPGQYASFNVMTYSNSDGTATLENVESVATDGQQTTIQLNNNNNATVNCGPTSSVHHVIIRLIPEGDVVSYDSSVGLAQEYPANRYDGILYNHDPNRNS